MALDPDWSFYLFCFLCCALCPLYPPLRCRLLQQGGDDIIGDVKELLIDLLIFTTVVVAGGKKEGQCNLI